MAVIGPVAGVAALIAFFEGAGAATAATAATLGAEAAATSAVTAAAFGAEAAAATAATAATAAAVTGAEVAAGATAVELATVAGATAAGTAVGTGAAVGGTVAAESTVAALAAEGLGAAAAVGAGAEVGAGVAAATETALASEGLIGTATAASAAAEGTELVTLDAAGGYVASTAGYAPLELEVAAAEGGATATGVSGGVGAAAGVGGAGVAGTVGEEFVRAVKDGVMDGVREGVKDRVKNAIAGSGDGGGKSDLPAARRDTPKSTTQQQMESTPTSSSKTTSAVATRDESTINTAVDVLTRLPPEAHTPELIQTLHTIVSNERLSAETRLYIAKEVLNADFTATQAVESQEQYRYAVYASAAYEQSEEKIYKTLNTYLKDSKYEGKLSTNFEKVKVFETYDARNRKNLYVISIKGTNPTDLQDLSADLLILSGLGVRTTALYRDAIKTYQRVRALHPNAEIVFTGHSLGGTVAASAARAMHENAVVFNMGAAPSDILTAPLQSVNASKRPSVIHQYRNIGDIVSLGAVSDPTIKTKTVHSPNFMMYLSQLLGHNIMQFLPASSLQPYLDIRDLALNLTDNGATLVSPLNGETMPIPARYAQEMAEVLGGRCVYNNRSGRFTCNESKKRKR